MLATITPDMARIPGRLSKYDRAEIAAAFQAGISIGQLAAEYKRTEQTIKNILRREGVWTPKPKRS